VGCGESLLRGVLRVWWHDACVVCMCLYVLVCIQCIVVLCEQPSISADIDDASQDELFLDDYRCLLSGSLAALNQHW